MIARLLASLSLVAASPALLGAEPPPVRFAQLTIHERLIIRVPRLSPAQANAQAARWEEKKAPRCLPMTSLTGAHIGRGGEVDLVVDGTKRIRASLDNDCPTLDFYSGFYLKPTRDGKLCAGRDALRSRSGARCEIDRFRTLVLKR